MAKLLLYSGFHLTYLIYTPHCNECENVWQFLNFSMQHGHWIRIQFRLSLYYFHVLGGYSDQHCG